nr:scarecrow-like protein 6 isoform X1 [Ipomoea batatas]
MIGMQYNAIGCRWESVVEVSTGFGSAFLLLRCRQMRPSSEKWRLCSSEPFLFLIQGALAPPLPPRYGRLNPNPVAPERKRGLGELHPAPEWSEGRKNLILGMEDWVGFVAGIRRVGPRFFSGGSPATWRNPSLSLKQFAGKEGTYKEQPVKAAEFVVLVSSRFWEEQLELGQFGNRHRLVVTATGYQLCVSSGRAVRAFARESERAGFGNDSLQVNSRLCISVFKAARGILYRSDFYTLKHEFGAGSNHQFSPGLNLDGGCFLLQRGSAFASYYAHAPLPLCPENS